MKKITLLVVLLAALFNANAQEPKFVSTEQENRNVLIEEFTGRMCGYCPYGQALVNQALAQYPGQVYTVNLHAESSLSPTSSPNLNTTKGAEVLLAFNNGGGIPAVVVNRGETMHPVEVSKVVPSMLEEVAECNIGGQVLINKETRTATVTVEVYYTANSASATNYLTVMMVQDSIFGYQSDYGPQLYGTPFNPEQMIDGQYVHMHTLRDYVTATWGDEITTTTAGSLVTKTYTYEIPEVIGDPNGVEVDLSDIHFMAFVSEKKQGTKTVPILNVVGLESLFVTNAEHYPYFNAITVGGNVSCTTVKPVTFEFVNGGTQDITSLKYEVTIWNNKTQYTWEGNLPSYTTMQVEEELNVPVGNLDAHFRIFEVNGQSHNYTEKVKLVNDGWIDAYFPGDEDEFKIDILQDKYGDHITWELLNSNEEVIASGGPYATLVANGIKLHRTKVKVPNNECVKFIIYDKNGDGINNGAGEGYYKISDSQNNEILKSDGKFGARAEHTISTKYGTAAIDEIANETYKIYPNPANEILSIEGENIKQVNVYNTVGQLVKSVSCNDNTVKVNVGDLQNGMYIVNVIDNNGDMMSKKVSVLK